MLGNKLVKLRVELGLTQTELTSKLSFSRVNYNRYEKNERTPDTYTLINLANFFGVSTDYLLGKSFLRNTADQMAFHLTKEELDPEDLIVIQNLIDKMRKKKNNP